MTCSMIDCFEYKIINFAPFNPTLYKYIKEYDFGYIDISNFGLYDTEKDNFKILCKKQGLNINCMFIEIIIKQKSNFYFDNVNILVFSVSNDWSEKNCYFSKYISENLF